MPFRQPLAPFEFHVADPYDLPIRSRGDHGLSHVVRAEVTGHDQAGVEMRAITNQDEDLFLALEVAADGVIRVRLAPDSTVATRSAPAISLVRSDSRGAGSSSKAHLRIDAERVRLGAGGVVADITLDPWKIRFLDEGGRLLVEQNSAVSDVSYRLRILPFGRSSFDGRVVAYHETFGAAVDEHFWGLGEKFTAFDKRGQRVISWNYDAFCSESERAYKNIPFYVSSRGYGLLVNSGMATEFDMCHSTHSCVQITVPDDLLEYFVIGGPEPATIIDRYQRLTGRPQPPPKWALGAWFSSSFVPDSQRRVVERAKAMRERGIPCDVIHLDPYWQRLGHWCDFQWDQGRFPDPAGMMAELHDMGFRVCLWICSFISRRSPLFDEAERSGYLMTRADGSAYAADSWHGYTYPCGIIDFTNPDATKWFQSLLVPLLEQGVDVFKSDFGEGIPVDAIAANGMTGEAVHNVYSLLYNEAVADITEKVNGHRLVWARSSFTGGQRHGVQWAGDNRSSYAAMGSTLRGGLSYAMSGVPFWSHDVGGFKGIPAPGLFVRSAQFGALSPFTRFHGASSRMPWRYKAPAEELIVEALRLRSRLVPYLYSAVMAACRTGVPVMRPLVFDSPADPVTWSGSADLEYRLGPDLLVAPIMNPDGERDVYLPAGTWIDYWTGEVHDGNRFLRVSMPLDRMPLFVRMGALIPMMRSAEVIGGTTFDDLVLTCWGRAGRERPERPERAEQAEQVVVRDEDADTTISVVREGERLQVSTTGPANVAHVVFPHVAGSPAPVEVSVNGRAAPPSVLPDWSAEGNADGSPGGRSGRSAAPAGQAFSVNPS
jgi:alpha-D-xyloside xylohydrolase